MGHAGYLTRAYRLYSETQIAEFYLKGEHLLSITIPEDLEQLRKDQAEQREILTAMASENRQLRADLILMQDELRTMKKLMAIVVPDQDQISAGE